MASADNRIVKLEFDNSNFEKNVAATIGTIGKLNESIAKIGGDGGGLKNMQAAANSFNMDGMGSAIDGISAKFVALSTIGITALANLTNRAIDAGLAITKALTVENIGQGFSEYELKLGSIQTIMAGSGADLDTVNKKLQELNEYSDQTIYSFADMTQNIGKFTNAGVSLDQSVASIKGIANVAALSGANAEEASRAMYNFAQALSKGHVQLMDWKSIELANMATVEFKQQLIDSAEAAGTLTKQGDKWRTTAGTLITPTENFNDSLTDQWLTTEALNKTLADYSDVNTDIGKRATAAASDVKTFTQLMGTVKESIGSGWAQSFEILIGNFDEAKWLFSGINDTIGNFVGKNADARNALLQGWKDLGGRNELIVAMDSLFRGFGDTLGSIKDAFREVFPPITAERLYELTKAFRLFVQSIRPSETTLENIKRIFVGVFNVISVGIDVFMFLVGAIKDVVKSLLGLAGVGNGNILAFFAELGDALANISSEKVIAGIQATFDKIGDLVKKAIPYIELAIEKIKEFFDALDIEMPEGLTNAIENIKDFFTGLTVGMPDAGPITNLLNNVKEAFSGIGDAIAGIFADFDVSGVGGAIGNVLSGIGDAFGGVVDSITGIFSSGGDMEKGIKEKADGIDWAWVLGGVGVAMVSGLLVTVNRLINDGINIDFTGGVLTSISDTFDGLTGTLKTMQQDIKADILVKIAGAIGVLAVSMVALSFIDGEKLTKAAVAIGVAFAQLAVAMKIMTKIEFSTTDAAKFTLMSVAFGVLAVGMLALSASLAAISLLSWEDLAKGMGTFGLIVASLIVMSKKLENEAVGMVKASVAMIGMAFSMDVMFGAIKKFGQLDTGALIQGMLGVGLAMGMLVLTMDKLPDDLEKKTAGVLGFSIALNLMVFAIKQLGNMDLGELVQGGIAFAAMLGVLVLALNSMPDNMGVQAAQLLALAGAMAIMGIAVKIFGSMGWEEMARGLIGMAGALGILVVAMVAAESGIVGAGAILIMSGALLLLAMAIKAFSAIGFADFAKGMLLVVVAIAALAGVAVLLSEAIPFMMALGAALALIGLGFAAIGFGAAQVAKALAILATIDDVGSVIIDTLMAVGKALPALFIGVAEGIGAMIEVLTGFIPQFIEFGVQLLSGLLEGLIVVVPKLLEFIGVLVTSIIDLIIEMVPQFVTMGMEILLGVLEGIRDTLPDIVIVVGEIIVGFLDALAEELPKIVESGANLFTTYLTSVAEAIGKTAPTLMFGVGIAFLQGFWDGMSSIVTQLWDFIKSIGTTVIDTIKSVFGINSPSTVMLEIGVDLIMGLYNGIVDTAKMVWDFFSGIAGEVLSKIGSLITTLLSTGKDIITGLWNGIKEIWESTKTWLGNLGTRAVAAVGSVITLLLSKGRDILTGLWDGIRDVWDSVKTWFGNLGTRIVSAVAGIADSLIATGRKVLDGLWQGMKDGWEAVKGWLGGLNPANWFNDINLALGHAKKNLLPTGKMVMVGLHTGMKDEWENITTWLNELNPADEMNRNMGANMAKVLDSAFSDLDINPTITPVMDLSLIQADAKKLQKLLPANSMAQAGIIAAYNPGQAAITDTTTPTAGVNFTQINNSPKQLSTVDIYRNTRNQIAMAKEELHIP